LRHDMPVNHWKDGTVLRGRIEDFHLSDICRLIANSRETGILHVEASEGTGAIFFACGFVRHARSSRVGSGFGRELVAQGTLAEDDLQRAVQICTVTGEPLEAALVAYGFALPGEVHAATLEQLKRTAIDLFSMARGRFEFEAGSHLPEGFPVAVPVEALLEAARRSLSVRRIEGYVPVRASAVGLDAVPADDAVFMSLADGQTTIKEIAARIGVDVVDALRSFYRLLTAGLVDVNSGSSEPEVIDLREERSLRR
jgi:hypothetical protein